MKKEIVGKIIRFAAAVLPLVTILGVTGVSLAWFWNIQQLGTVAMVQIPSQITLSGANRSELQRISLELTADDKNDGETITLRRVFCVESTADFWLEVVRTTNIEGMEIRIYPVKSSNSDLDSGVVKGTDGVNTYYYTPDGESLSGSYLNREGTIANKQLHDENYAAGDQVQKHAEPLYWRTASVEKYDRKDYSTQETADDRTNIFYRYYVLELQWGAQVQETDLVYLLASH